MSDPTLSASQIRHAYRGRTVLHDASLELAPGQVVSLLGANGAGKSTLLRIILGLLPPQGGEVRLGGRPLRDYPRRELAGHLAYVPQVHATPFPYSVRQVVLMGRLPATGLFAAPGHQDRMIAEQALARLGIGHLAERPYTEISGGERQMALIARALAQGSRLLILDEPATGLDYGNQIALLDLLRSLAAEGYGILKTTHHPDHVLASSDRVAILKDGHIIADGPPENVMSAALLSDLYGVAIAPTRLPDGRLVILPAADRARRPPSAAPIFPSTLELSA
ncbi:MAG: transporter [Proteobacteria bacterium]|nr:transporter [Pseudomonadota bacterium]